MMVTRMMQQQQQVRCRISLAETLRLTFPSAQLHSLWEAQAQTQLPNMWHWRFYIREWGLEPHLRYAEGVRIEAPVPLVSFRLA